MRSVAAGVLDNQPGTVWFDAPALIGPAGVVLVHPALRDVVTISLRRQLTETGVTLAPSSVLRLDGRRLSAPSFSGSGTPPLDWQLVGAALPPTESEASRVIALAHIARRWDVAHLQTTADLATRIPMVIVTPGAPRDEVVRQLGHLVGA